MRQQGWPEALSKYCLPGQNFLLCSLALLWLAVQHIVDVHQNKKPYPAAESEFSRNPDSLLDVSLGNVFFFLVSMKFPYGLSAHRLHLS